MSMATFASWCIKGKTIFSLFIPLTARLYKQNYTFLAFFTRHSHRTVGDAKNFSLSTVCRSCCPVTAYYSSCISSDIFLLSTSWIFGRLMKIKVDNSIINLYLWYRQFLSWIFKEVLWSLNFKALTKNKYLSDYLGMHCAGFVLHFVMPSSFKQWELERIL